MSISVPAPQQAGLQMRCGLKPHSLPDHADEAIEFPKLLAMHASFVGAFTICDIASRQNSCSRGDANCGSLLLGWMI
jgi:hypothetical protein